MNIKSQEENPLVEIIRRAMDDKIWNANKLALASGVAQPVISRLLGGSINIKVASIYKILYCLDLLQSQSSFGSAWPEEVKKACRDLAKILLSANEVVKQAILANLAVFKLTLEQEERIGNLEREVKERRKRESQRPLDATAQKSQSTGRKAR